MDNEDWKRLKGLQKLVHDGVEEGANFVEKHHRHTAAKPFRVLESIQPIAAPTRLVRMVHDGVLSLSYGGIRGINRSTRAAGAWVVGKLEPDDDAD